METQHKPPSGIFNPIRFKGLAVCGAILLSFAAGSLMTGRWMHLRQARADSNRVFELMIYHTIPGKASELEAIFREDSKVMAKHGLDVLGFWVPNEDPAWKDTFVYVVAFPSREEATKRWHELHVDPAARPYVEAAKPILDKVGGGYHVDEVYMRPTDFSAVK